MGREPSLPARSGGRGGARKPASIVRGSSNVTLEGEAEFSRSPSSPGLKQCPIRLSVEGRRYHVIHMLKTLLVRSG